MRSAILPGIGFAIVAAAAVTAQGQPPTARPGLNLQAPQDPRYADIIARCSTPPGRGGGGRGAAPGGATAPGAARGVAAPPAAAAEGGRGFPRSRFTREIPGVIAAEREWTTIYQTTGNNADGPIAADDGGLLIAQNDNGTVLKIAPEGQATTLYRDTNTGGSLAMSSNGTLFVASRGIDTSVLQLAPQRRVFANRYQGEPLECLGGVINDLTADSRGGVYFTMGGLFYADSLGMVTSYGENLQTNGVILSPDEKTLYVTNGQSIAAFDVRPDGSLANQRAFASLPAGSGDGMTVDADGRLYVTAGGGGASAAPGVAVFARDGEYLGLIPSPRNLITVAFAGADKKTLFAIANDRQNVDVYAIPMIAEGYKGRAK